MVYKTDRHNRNDVTTPLYHVNVIKMQIGGHQNHKITIFNILTKKNSFFYY